MSYDPTLVTVRDRIRFLVIDINEADELFPDETYDSLIADSSNWKLAAASMAESIAVLLERRVASLSVPGDVALGWSDRARTLRSTASRLRLEVATEEQVQDSAVQSIGLTRGGSSVSEYRPASPYRRLRR